MTRKFTLGKDERLKSRKLIDELFDKGQKFSTGFFRVHFLFNESAESKLQFGAGVSNKNFKKAVDRNRIKRLTKEAWRLQKNELNEKLLLSGKMMNVFLIYTGKTIPEYSGVFETITKIINKLTKTIPG
ncbi:MAG: ribonuclease P protein component [Chitinophagaceae bacterium]|nr:ribonuclease P protein component [Chitinophagaceae bacterium]